MADSEVEALRRRYAQTNAHEDLVALLQARLRRGDLSGRSIELAARLGDPGARALCAVVPIASLDDLAEVLADDAPGAVRVGLALVRWVGRRIDEDWRRAGGVVSPVAARAALDAWVACPCPEHAAMVRATRPAYWDTDNLSAAGRNTVSLLCDLVENGEPRHYLSMIREVLVDYANVDEAVLVEEVRRTLVPVLLAGTPHADA